MNHIAGKGFFNTTAASVLPCHTLDFCIQSVMRFPANAAEGSELSLAKALLLRLIRNVFVHDSAVEGEIWFHDRSQSEVTICIMINVLELYGMYNDWNVVGWRAGNISYKLSGGNRRDLVKFVAKRLPCTCLKKLHRVARKKVEKVGICHGCNKQLPRSRLYVCTGCRVVEYCSNDCQTTHWSTHKRNCGDPEPTCCDLPADCNVQT